MYLGEQGYAPSQQPVTVPQRPLERWWTKGTVALPFMFPFLLKETVWLISQEVKMNEGQRSVRHRDSEAWAMRGGLRAPC